MEILILLVFLMFMGVFCCLSVIGLSKKIRELKDLDIEEKQKNEIEVGNPKNLPNITPRLSDNITPQQFKELSEFFGTTDTKKWKI